MKTFEVWCSGSFETDPFFVGRTEANTFQEACDKVIHRESGHHKNYCSASRSIWGCTLYPTYAEANGFRPATSYTADDQLVLKVGDAEILRLPFRRSDSSQSIHFCEAGWLAGKLKEMVDKLNMERYQQ